MVGVGTEVEVGKFVADGIDVGVDKAVPVGSGVRVAATVADAFGSKVATFAVAIAVTDGKINGVDRAGVSSPTGPHSG